MQQIDISAQKWVWLQHPDHNNGQPVPAQLFILEGVVYFRPFNTHAGAIEWEKRSANWAGPLPLAPSLSSLEEELQALQRTLSCRDTEIRDALSAVQAEKVANAALVAEVRELIMQRERLLDAITAGTSMDIAILLRQHGRVLE